MTISHSRPALFEAVRDCWAVVLDWDEDDTGEPLLGTSHFFRCGGDSSLARELCGELRIEHGISLPSATVFQHPTLDGLVDAILALTSSTLGEKSSSRDKREDVALFSLLPSGQEQHGALVQELASMCGLDAQDVEDAYPCTALQEGLVSLSQRDPGSYWASHVFKIDCEEDLSRFCKAWDQVIQTYPILRTSIAQTHAGTLLQVVSRTHPAFATVDTDLQSFLQDSSGIANTLNAPLSRFSVLRRAGDIRFVWRIHHAAYDVASTKLILAGLEQAWHGQAVPSPTPFQTFIAETLSHKLEDARHFWTERLQGAGLCVLPSHSSQSPTRPSFATEVHRLDTQWQQRGSEFSLPTLLHAAWSLVLARHAGVDDVTYGAVLSSREASWRAVAAPIISTIPVRLPITSSEPVKDFLLRVQGYFADAQPYAHMGIQRIRQLGADMEAACSFQSLMVTHPIPDHASNTSTTSTLPQRSYVKESSFHTYDLTVEAFIGSTDIEVKAHHNEAKISQKEAQRLLRHFEMAVSQLICAMGDEPSPSLSSVDLCGPDDLEEIRSFNSQCPEPELHCMHLLLSQAVQESPQSPAIIAHDAPDGLSYHQLDATASTLARKLIAYGIEPGQMVPLLFEKSAWAVVAMLAVLKAGATFVPLEWTHPVERLRKIIAQVHATTVLASHQNEALASELQTQNLPILVSEPTLSDAGSDPTVERIELPSVHPTSLAYAVFTSGSTGVPKGVMISHQAFCTSAAHHGPALGFTKSSRVLQFSSYSFDVSIAEIFTTLISGGCLCIPTEDERIQDLPGAIRRMCVSLAVLTPAMFENFSTEDRGSLSTVVLTGDSSSQHLVDKWSSRLVLMNAYGPSESSVWAYTHRYTSSSSSNAIGLPRGCVGWIVDAEDVNKLAPVGCAGELLLQGPILSNGYLNEPEKTKSSFVSNLAWQQESDVRLYVTGDLVRQNTDGSMCFLGRKDTQIKIRGQRVEVSEIENHIRQLLPGLVAVAVEVVRRVLEDHNSNTLVAFCCFNSKPGEGNTGILSQDNHTEAFLRLRATLSSALPSYMVPQAYVPVSSMPVGVAGKLDRKKLRSVLLDITDDQWRSYLLAAEYEDAVLSSRQAALRSHWASCLNIKEASIHLQDSFFRLGGTSILAMRLSSLCRQHLISLSVAAVFQNPVLEAMAEAAQFQGVQNQDKDTEEADIEPFSLLQLQYSEHEQVIDHLARLAGISPADIEDAYPATPLQEGLIAATQAEPDAYISQRVHHLQGNMSRFERAWAYVVAETAILRTRLVQTQRWGLLQVVTRNFDLVKTTTSLEHFVSQERERSVPLGESLNRYSIITDPNQGDFFVWQAHHAAFDGWSLRLVFERFMRVYNSTHDITPPIPFKAFVHKMQNLDKATAASFWRQRLEGSRPCEFPKPASRRSGRGEIENSSSTLKFALSRDWRKDCDFTLSTILSAAWALVIATHTDTDDVVFGTTRSGRAAPIAGIEKILGPTMTTIPVRLTIEGTRSLQDFLVDIHSFLTDVIPFEQFGLKNIRALGPDAEAACTFKTLLLLQPPDESDLTNLRDIAPRVKLSTVNSRYQTYDISLEVLEVGDDLELRMNYNTFSLEPKEVSWLLSHVKAAVITLTDAVIAGTLAQTTVGEVSLFSSEDQGQLCEWNSEQPVPTNRCIHDLVSEAVNRRPAAEAIRAWDGDVAYMELDGLSSRLAHKLVHDIGVRPTESVLLCFEKSKLAVIAMLAVLKAGAIMVPLEWSHPHTRLEEIAKGVKARVALTTEKYAATCASLEGVEQVFSTDALIAGPAVVSKELTPLPEVSPNQTAYIIFTSGSTGKPKGIPVSHLAFSTTISKFGRAYLLTETSRVFHFSSYAFDVSLMETLIPLCYGATVCIPPEQGRKNNLAAEFVKLEANFALLGPGVVSTLDLRTMIGLQVLVLGGEAVPDKMLQEWGQVADVVVAYGSTECAAVDHALAIPRGTTPPSWAGGLLGRSIGSARSWVVSTTDHGRLAPLGCNGELVIEGPVVGHGYLNEEAKTRSHYIPAAEVAWLRRYPGQPEDQQARYVYKTGDIVRYNVDGSLSYFGRKDLRIKIHGQRVEMGDIEACTRLAMPQLVSCTAELVRVRRPGNAGEAKSLAIFVCFPTPQRVTDIKGDNFLSHDYHEDDMLRLQSMISSSLPSHMVPELFIPASYIPTAASGKIDRKRLQSALLPLDDDILSHYQLSRQSEYKDELPVTQSEKIIQELWADCLDITDKDAISRQSHFLRLGGNSISAMRLAALASEHMLSLTVVDILKYPVLSEMAEAAKTLHSGKQQVEEEIAPFSLIPVSLGDSETLISRIGTNYNVDPAEIVDVYPCTPLQEGLVALTHVKPREYIACHVFQTSSAFGVDATRSALQTIIAANPILRTRIVEDSQLIQVVTKTAPAISELTLPVSLALARLRHQNQQPILGRPLSEFMIIRDEGQNCVFVIWKAHHAAYDGWTVLAVANQLRAALIGEPLPVTSPFNRFIAHLKRLNKQDGAQFWKSKLKGSIPCSLPRYESESTPGNQATSTIDRSVPMPTQSSISYTLSTLLHAAWAVLLATYTTASEVVFGTVMSGRHAAVAGIDQVMGATVATIPLRVQLNRLKPVTELLEQIHSYMTEATPFEQMGLQHIRRLSVDTDKACDFETLLVVQPLGFAMKEGEQEAVRIYRSREGSNEKSRTPGTYTITLECIEKRDGLDLRLHFNTSALPAVRAGWILTHFTRIIEQLLTAASQDHEIAISDLDLVGPADLAAMNISQDHVDGSDVQECVHAQILRHTVIQPQRIAVDAWDGRLSYHELARLSLGLSNRLLRQGLELEEPVLLCIDKSKLFPVAALAVLAAGGTIVPVDASHPIERLLVITREAGVTKCLCTESTSAIAKDLGLLSFEINSVLSEENSASLEPQGLSKLPDIDPQKLAYIIFTSGSTGIPKGVLVSHASLSTSSRHHAEAYEMGARSRVLHFASYAFDVSLAETLTTLMVGGCICIPSGEECRNDLAAAMEHYHVSLALLTPSVVSTLRPADVPHLTTLVLGGERHTAALRETWQRHCQVVNGYGPAECSISVSSTLPTSVGKNPARASVPSDVGVPHQSVAAWITDALDPNKLVPFGCVGELLIGGPQVARGYLNDSKKTDASFLTDLAWMHHLDHGRPQRVYRTGDLVHWGMDGHMILVGRQDDQVKVRGQRLELGDVEAHLQKIFDGFHTVAVVPKAGPLEGSLVVLLTDSLATGSVSLASQGLLDIHEGLVSLEQIQRLQQRFESSVPPSMIPSLWLPVRLFPLSSSGKVDRKMLSKATECLSPEKIASIRSFTYPAEEIPPKETPTKEIPTEETHNSAIQDSRPAAKDSLEIIQRAVAEVLQVPVSFLEADPGASFKILGGDSIRAMILSSRLRQAGIPLKALDILQAKRLSSLWSRAQITKTSKTNGVHSVAADRTKKYPTQLPSQTPLPSLVPGHKVEVILPCSAVQSYMFWSSQRNSTHYRAASIVQILPRNKKPFDKVMLARAWGEVVKAHPLLRSAMIPTDGKVHLAVLGDFAGSWECVGECLRSRQDGISLLKGQIHKPFAHGRPQYRILYCTLAESNDMLVMFDMHHALVDGASIAIALRDMDEAYHGRVISSRDTFLEGLGTRRSVTLPTAAKPCPVARPFPRASKIPISQPVELEDGLTSCLLHSTHLAGFTLSTIVQAAWALTLHEITGDQFPAFGVLLTHRQDTSSGTVGPLFDIYTQRAKVATGVNSAEEFRELLTSIQEQTLHLATEGYSDAAASISNKHSGNAIEWNTLVNMRYSSSKSKLNCRGPEPLWEFEYLWAMDPMDHDVVVSGRSSNGKLQLCLNYFDGVTAKEDTVLAAHTLGRYLRTIGGLDFDAI